MKNQTAEQSTKANSRICVNTMLFFVKQWRFKDESLQSMTSFEKKMIKLLFYIT